MSFSAFEKRKKVAGKDVFGKNYKTESKWSRRPAASCNVDSFFAKQNRST
jgi:hypothetical protein